MPPSPVIATKSLPRTRYGAAIQETQAGKRQPMARSSARSVGEPVLVPGNAPFWIAAYAAMTDSLWS